MTRIRSRLFSAFIALMVVFSMLAGPAVQPASALDYEECAKDWLTGSLVETTFDYIMGNPNYCLEITESDFSAQTQTDMVASMKSHEASTDQALTAFDNRLQDSQSVALTKAKIAVVNELNNGSNKSVATQAGKDAIDEYYATIEVNLMGTWDTAVIQSRYVSQTALDTGDSQTSWIDYSDWETQPEGQSHTHIEGSNSTHLDEPPIVNWTDRAGEKHETRALVNKGHAFDYVYWHHPITYRIDESELYNLFGSPDAFKGSNSGEINVTDAEGDVSTVVRFDDYRSRMSEIDSRASSSKSNVQAYVDGVYAHYSAGELSTEDLLDPTEIYAEASTDRNSTGYYGWASVQLASIGYGGNMNHSHVVETTYQNQSVTWEGTLFYTDDDVDEFETGVMYDPSTMNGSVMMAVNNGTTDSAIREISENFTITEASNPMTGETVTTTTVEKKVYNTTNATELENELNRLRELKEQLNHTEAKLDLALAATGGSGGGALFGLGIADWARNNPAAAAVGGGVGVIVFVRLLAPGP